MLREIKLLQGFMDDASPTFLSVVIDDAGQIVSIIDTRTNTPLVGELHEDTVKVVFAMEIY